MNIFYVNCAQKVPQSILHIDLRNDDCWETQEMAVKIGDMKKRALAAIILGASLLGASVHAADYPTAKVNTTGLAVTDKTVTVGI
ncbi:MAG TPA: hypothetical protein VFM32_01210, partial [Spongiibacteraceae bacterium]|nr:hypothetical protein [Spongiibacteraceae bacterium]